MTIEEIQDFVRERGKEFSRADLDRLKDMVADLPLEQLRGLNDVLEALRLTIADTLSYQGDLSTADLDDGE